MFDKNFLYETFVFVFVFFLSDIYNGQTNLKRHGLKKPLNLKRQKYGKRYKSKRHRKRFD